MKVFWTDTAIQHLAAIYAYIAQNSPQQVIDRLTRRSEHAAVYQELTIAGATNPGCIEV